MEKRHRRFLEFWYSHTKLGTAILLLGINIALTLVFALVFMLITKINYGEALKYCSILAISSDGIWTIQEMFGGSPYNVMLIVHVIVIIIQMLFFSGALIGFVSAILDSIFDNVENSRKKLHLSNHYVLLNWSDLGPNLVYDLSFKNGHKTVVILSNHDRDEVITSIKDIFTENKKKIRNIRFFVKQGDPFIGQNLADISIENANSVGILQDSDWENGDKTFDGLTQKDFNAFKLLMSIINLVDDASIVVEAERRLLETKVDALFKNANIDNKKITVFSHNLVIGHILGKALVRSEYVDFYTEVLSYEGVEFYGIEPMPMKEALDKYSDCIPVALYDDDDVVDEDGNKAPDHLYILDEDGKATERKTRVSVTRKLDLVNNLESENISYFIVGDELNNKFICEEIEDSKKINKGKIEYDFYNEAHLDKLVADIKKSKADRKVLLLSHDRRVEDTNDANILVDMLSLSVDYDILNDVELFVEVKNPNNFVTVKNMGVAKTIISNKLISLFMIQLLTHPESRKFYKDILVPNDDLEDSGIDFEIIKASSCLKMEDKLVFKSKTELVQSFFNSTNGASMIIGYKNKGDERIKYLASNMDKEEEIVLDKDSLIVVTKYN